MTAGSSAELRPVGVDQVEGAEPTLTIYHLVRIDSVDHDAAQELVVSAANVEHTRQYAADANSRSEMRAWFDPRRSTVNVLGTAPAAASPARVLVFNILGA